MNVILFFITKKITTFMILILILSLGIYSFVKLPADLLPETDTKGITIIVRYPGQSPYKIEEIITKPIEDVLSTIGGIEQIVSASEDNESRIYITFGREIDIQFKAYEVREKIEPVRSLFPRDVNEPEVYLQSNDYSPIMIIGLDSDTYTVNELRDIAEHTLKKQLERVVGVSQIETGGGNKREIHIIIDNKYCSAYNFSMLDITTKLQSNNIIASLGILHEPSYDYSLHLQSRFLSLNDISLQPVISSSTGSVIRIKDIGMVVDYAGKYDSISRYNFQEQVSLYIYKTSIANPIDVSHEICNILSKNNLPNVNLKTIYTSADEITKALNNLYISCFWGIIITIIVLFAFLKKMIFTMPVIIAIPFSFMAIVVYLFFSNATLNVITLSGLAIATGMVVDNSIIVIERIFENVTMENKKLTIAIIAASTNKIMKAIFASSLTTIVVFSPVILLKTKSTSLYLQLSATIISAIIASFIAAIIFVPWCINIFESWHFKPLLTYKFIKDFGKKTIFNSALLYCEKIALHIKSFPYFKMFEYSLNNKKKALSILTLMAFSILIPIQKLYFEPINFTDENKLFARLEMPSGSSLDASSNYASDIEHQLKINPYVTNISTRIEPGHADFIISIDKPSHLNLIKNKIIEPFDTSLIFTENTGQLQNEVEIIIQGQDIETIRKLIYELSEKLYTTAIINNIIYHFKDDRPEVIINFDKIKCAHNGIYINQIGDYIRNTLFGPVITKYIDNGEVDIRLKGTNPIDIANDIANIRIPHQNSTIVLQEFATIDTSKCIHTLWHYDKMRAETISIIPKIPFNKMEKILNGIINDMKIPDGYFIEYGKTFKQQKQSQLYITVYIVIAVILVYMVLSAIFESLMIPLIVIVSVPISWIFAIWILFITNVTFNITAAMGFIVLTGTVVNNSILLIDAYLGEIAKRHKKRYLTVYDYFNLSKKRLRPMLATTITTVTGLLPLIVSTSGSHLWQGFAITLTAGLCGSLLFILVTTPLLFDLYQKKFINP